MTRRVPLFAVLLALAFSIRLIFARTLDVTDKVTAQIKDDGLSLPVDSKTLVGVPSEGDPQKLELKYTQGELTAGASNDNFGDPSSGNTKTLLIHYSVNGTPYTASLYDVLPTK